MPSCLALLSAAALVAATADPPRRPGARPAGFHAVATVTDSLSHGQVGDGLLSLNEAILLHNGQLAFSQLSPQEQQVISLIPGTGMTTDVTWIDIDGTSTPVITVERDLDPIVDTPYGLLIQGFNDPPVIDFSGPGLQHGFRAPANGIILRDVVVQGGPYGLDCTQTDVTGQSGCVVANTRFHGQAQFGVRVTAAGAGGIGKLLVQDCTFTDVPQPVVVDETAANRTTIVEVFGLRATGAQRGLELLLGSGGVGRYTFDRLDVQAALSGLRLRRPGGASRSALVESTFVQLRAADGALLETAAGGGTSVALRMWDVVASGSALRFGALGHTGYGTIEDSALHGATAVLAGGIAQPLRLQNCVLAGAVTVGSAPLQPLLLVDCQLHGGSLQTQGSAPVAVQNGCFAAGAVAGTAAAPLQCTASYVANPGPFTTQVAPRPAAQLGRLLVTPDDVPVGSTVTFQADLPPGLLGILVLGFTDPQPLLLPAPLHVYSQPALTVTLPGVYTGQQAFPWSIPAFPIYQGLDFTATMAVLPTAGTSAPPLHIPPGTRFQLL